MAETCSGHGGVTAWMAQWRAARPHAHTPNVNDRNRQGMTPPQSCWEERERGRGVEGGGTFRHLHMQSYCHHSLFLDRFNDSHLVSGGKWWKF